MASVQWASASGAAGSSCPLGCLPGLFPASWHSPAQGKELAVAVERHIPQVEDLQPREVAHVGDVAHLVALQVEASDLGTEASEGTGGNLQRSVGDSGGSWWRQGSKPLPLQLLISLGGR